VWPGARTTIQNSLVMAMVSRRPGSVLNFLCELPRAQPQDVVFNYSSGESYLIAAPGRGRDRPAPWPTTAPRRSGALPAWRPMGIGKLDAEGGMELGGFWRQRRGCATFGRFGQAGAGGRRSVQWPTGCYHQAGAISPDSQTARATAFGRPMPGFASGIRLPVVGAAALA